MTETGSNDFHDSAAGLAGAGGAHLPPQMPDLVQADASARRPNAPRQCGQHSARCRGGRAHVYALRADPAGGRSRHGSLPGGFHLDLARNGANYVCRVHDEAPVSGHRPSVDGPFRSVAHAAGANAVGIILTGMGRDGAVGLLDMRSAGASTVGQDEATCVVCGLPKATRDCGAVEIELPLNKVAHHVLQRCEALAGCGVRV